MSRKAKRLRAKVRRLELERSYDREDLGKVRTLLWAALQENAGYRRELEAAAKRLEDYRRVAIVKPSDRYVRDFGDEATEARLELGPALVFTARQIPQERLAIGYRIDRRTVEAGGENILEMAIEDMRRQLFAHFAKETKQAGPTWSRP